jgi:hypothetical protein
MRSDVQGIPLDMGRCDTEKSLIYISNIRYLHRGTLHAGVASPHPEIKKRIWRLEMYLEKEVAHNKTFRAVHEA